MKHLLAIAIVCASRIASAAPVVVAVDGADVYVDLGAADGVGAGSELELLHEVVARDPRNGAELRDRFALGNLTVVRSGEHLSVAKADDALRERILAGDQVRLVSVRRHYVDAWAERVTPVVAATPAPVPQPPGVAVDHAELARIAWGDTLGKPLQARVDRWLALLAQDPTSPYRAAVQREIATLRAQITQREAALATAREAHPDDRGARIARLATQLGGETADAALIAAPVARAVAGQPLAMAFVVRTPTQLAGAWLYARPHGDAGFTRIALVADGDAYLRGTIAGALVKGTTVQWYVEVAYKQADGATLDPEPVLGSSTAPRTIAVDHTVGEAPIAANRSHVDMHVDYVDFDGGFNKGFDQYTQAELDFTYRFLEPVYAVRLGFGTLAGVGGPKDVIDGDFRHRCLDDGGTFRCTRVNFNYVYTELEFRLQKNVALMVRPQAGLLTTDDVPDMPADRCKGQDITGCRFLTGIGARGRLRLGDEAGTNLVIGAGFTKGVGTVLEAAYNWRPHPVVPVQLSVQVTDQPVVEDLGVRLIADVGWRQLSWFYPSVRVSYQARDIDHGGASGGLAMNFDW